MAKKKEKLKLPPAAEVPKAKAVLAVVNQRKERLNTVCSALAQEGKSSKYNPKYRQALKRLKRAQRRIRKLVLADSHQPKPKSKAAPPAPASPPPETQS